MRILWANIEGVTSSPELPVGNTPCSSPTGPPSGKSGRVAAPVNHSATRAKEKAPPTSGTCGPTSCDLSPSAALQQSLESRLRANLDVNGSPEYVLTWKHWVMQSGPPICRLQASARRTGDTGFSGWPTVTARDGRSLKGARDMPNKVGGPSLSQLILTGWVPLTARDYSRGVKPPRPQDRGIPLSQQVAMTGAPEDSQLNPHFTRWLMGFPPEWCDHAVMATR